MKTTNENAEMLKSLLKANRRQLENFMIDCIGYREYELEDWSMHDMRSAILDYEIVDGQGDQFGGYTF